MHICSYTGNTDLLTESKGKNTAVIILFTLIGVALLLVIGIACCLFTQRRKETKSSIGKLQKVLFIIYSISPASFLFPSFFFNWQPEVSWAPF
jgi:flagellar basal body-associated protein FliL